MCRGEYNQSTTKVLHFTMNPSSSVYANQKHGQVCKISTIHKLLSSVQESAQTLTLQKENKELKAKLTQLEQAS
jgi:hypothetical protein